MLARLSRGVSLPFFLFQKAPKLTPHRFMSSTKTPTPNSIKIVFKWTDGKSKTVSGKVGDSLLDVVLNNNIDIDGFGACEGTLACSTCHLIFHPTDYNRLPSKPSDEEMDMLDLAYDLTDTSRLGCQINLTQEMDGVEVLVPASTMDARG